ncbi:MAG: VCBS repeat-containing protein, partial [Candidatus Andersenbacteria bacterium]|nr:VCBS repeat-containing protein [Candidatus Andersenbacteria bacterium]
TLAEGDELLLTLGGWPSSPLSVELSTSEVLVGDSLTATVLVYDDESRSYEPANRATVLVDTETFMTGTDGTVSFTPSFAGSFRVIAERASDTRSAATPLQVYARNAEFVDSLPRQQTQALSRGLNYLQEQASVGGDVIETPGATSWAGMALAAGGRSLDSVGSSSKSVAKMIGAVVPGEGATVLDWERQVLAVVAAGGDPHNWEGQDWVSPIRRHSGSGQIGDVALVNDDVFGVIALLAAKESAADPLVVDGIKMLLEHQNVDGGYAFTVGGSSDTDTTAAAIQALVLYRDHGGLKNVSSALRDARTFLVQQQKPDGGFAYESGYAANVASTAWAVQAIYALGEDPMDWQKNNKTPIHFMLALQQENGSFAWIDGLDGTALMTSYAVLALAGQPLPAMQESSLYVFTPGAGGGPQVVVKDSTWKTVDSFFAFDSSSHAGLEVQVGDVDGDGFDEIVAVQGPGAVPEVRVFSMDGTQERVFMAFSSEFRGGTHLELADIDGDAVEEIVVSPMAAGGPHVRVFSGSGIQRASFFAYDEQFRGGVLVRSGDTNGDGMDELITVPSSGGSPHVRVFTGTGTELASFFSFDNKQLRGGYHLAVGDVSGDRKDEIVLAPRAGMGAHVNVFSGTGELQSGFFAFENFIGGVHLSLGDLDGDGVLEIVTTPEIGQPHVRVFTKDGEERASFYAYDAAKKGVGVHALIVDSSRDGTSDLLVTPGAGLAAPSQVFSSVGRQLSVFDSHIAGFSGGIQVAR